MNITMLATGYGLKKLKNDQINHGGYLQLIQKFPLRFLDKQQVRDRLIIYETVFVFEQLLALIK